MGCCTYSRRNLFWLLMSPRPTARDTLVCVFLRGGADGLNLVVPYGDEAYYDLRPTIGIARPDHTSANGSAAIDLDGFFGLHPKMAPLVPAWKEGNLAIVHAVGSDDGTRSHFEAQDRMEQGGPNGKGIGSGWLARHLRTRPGLVTTSLSAVAIDTETPESLRGAPGSAAIESIDDFRLKGDKDGRYLKAIETLYSRDKLDPVLAAGKETIQAIHRMEKLRTGGAEPRNGAQYPNDRFGRGLREIARLIQSKAGLEVACIDLDGWDTHFVQGPLQDSLADQLANGLAAFRKDLGAAMGGVTVAVMTEFGRRAYENGSVGTDHGRASAMFVMGGGVNGGKVYGDWPGLAGKGLVGPGDLAVTTDYRSVLAEVVDKRLRNPNLRAVFPGFKPKPLGIIG